MYAKHLMSVSARKPDPVYVYGNPADYVASSNVPGGALRRLVYDTNGRIVFSRPTAGPTLCRGSGRVGAGTNTAFLIENPNNPLFGAPLPSTVQVWSTDNHGVSAKVKEYTVPGTDQQAYIATDAGVMLATDGPVNSNQQKVVFRDLASGASYADPKVYSYQSAITMASREAIYFQADYAADALNADPRTFLQAGNGRAARAKILPVDQSLKRFVARYTINGPVDVTLTPWRRPLTTDTKCRTYSWSNGVGDAIRAGKLHRRVGIFTHEIEISASQGVVVSNGVRFTRHTLSYYRGGTFGLVRLTLANGAEIIPVGLSMAAATWTVLQYLDANDVPSNEYIIEATGSWTSVNDSALARTSSGHPRTPACVGMNAVVVTHTDGQRLALYDLAGNFMKATNPPGGNIPVDWTGTGWDVPSTGVDGAFFHVQSHDLIVRADGYDKIVPATFDMGMTWVNTYIPSNPNSPPPTGYVPPANGGVAAPAPVAPPAQNGNAFLVGISVWSPVFLT